MCLVEVYLKEFALVKFLGYFDIAGKQDSCSVSNFVFVLLKFYTRSFVSSEKSLLILSFLFS